MVCKEEIVVWFKELSAYRRIDVMCTLLHMCFPLELRFLGTCLEDLGKKDFHTLREREDKANNCAEYSDLQCVSDKRTQRRLALYLSLLHSCNRLCADGLYKILCHLDPSEINTILNNSAEENPLEELLLVYTLAINHPAFNFEQKTVFGNLLYMIQDEENKLIVAKTPPPSLNLLYLKPALQSYVPCLSAEERTQQDVVLGPCPAIPLPGAQSSDLSKGRGSVPPPMGVPPGITLTPEQLPNSYHVQMFPSPGHQPMPWPGSVTPIVMCGSMPAEGQPYSTSPPPSQQSSPSQSESPSRSNSPVRSHPPPTQVVSKGNPSNRRIDGNRQNCVDKSTSQHSVLSTKSSIESLDPLKETLGKEMPSYQQNLQNYSVDELRRMGDEELKELGLPPSAINQLRSIVTKLNTTNGLTNLDKQDPPPARRKTEPNDIEQVIDRKGPVLRRYGSCMVPPEATGVPVMFPSQQPCIACYAVPMPSTQSRQVYIMNQMNNTFRNLRIDPDNRNNSNSSSASESSSASHSPPDTPLTTTTTTTTQWDKGYIFKDATAKDRYSPEEKSEKDRRVPEMGERPPNDVSRPRHSGIVSHRPRMPGGVGRGKPNPPGMQTVARGRGPDGSHKSFSASRPSMNGNQNSQPTRQLSSHVHQPTSSELLQMSQYPPPVSSSSQPQSRPNDGTVSYTHSTPFMQHYPTIRTTASLFQNFPPGSYVRPAFPYSPNGELLYQYHAPQNPTPPPPQPSFMPPIIGGYTPVQPPKSCYNCGSNSHYPIDCKEPTMEEVTQPGTYRLDYSSQYPKHGEIQSEK